MIVLLDLDVVLDFALDRAPFAEASAQLLDKLAAKRSGKSAKDFLIRLTRFVEVAPIDTKSFHYAANLPMGDFEEAMQVASAVACRADVIATRNLRDYANSPIRATAPKDLIGQLK